MEDVKPGYQTTEFWLTLIAQLTSLSVALGFIDANLSSELQSVAAQVAGLVVSVYSLSRYLKSRAEVKVAGLRLAAARAESK